MALDIEGLRADPIGGYNFLITFIDSTNLVATAASAIQNVALGGFSECSGLEMTLEIEEYKEGGNNGTLRKFPTRVNWADIRLSRGVTNSEELWNWHYSFVEGKGKVRRRDGIIVLQNDQHVPVKVWHFTRGLPIKWTGPTMNASQSEIAVEELTIAHEGLQVYSVGSALQQASAVLF